MLIYLFISLFVCVSIYLCWLAHSWLKMWAVGGLNLRYPRKNQSLNSLKSQQKADRFPEEIATNEIVKPGRTFNGLVLGKIHRKLGKTMVLLSFEQEF